MLKKPRYTRVFRKAIRGNPLENFQSHSGVSFDRLVSDIDEEVDRGPSTISASSTPLREQYARPRASH